MSYSHDSLKGAKISCNNATQCSSRSITHSPPDMDSSYLDLHTFNLNCIYNLPTQCHKNEIIIISRRKHILDILRQLWALTRWSH